MTDGPVSPARRRRAAPLVAGILAYALGALALNTAVFVGIDAGRTQWVEDQWTVLTEPVDPEVAAIADATGMSAEGRLIYLATRPEVETTASFNDHCDVEGTIVLGCYTPDDRIYVYGVSDDRLAGTVEVTAAHEMLHAAYERLSEADRRTVDALVADAVAALPADDPLFAALETYPRAQQADEWHSRLATEVADLPAALEAHYAVYFDDRSRVIALHLGSTEAIRELEAQIDALASEIAALDASITAELAEHDAAIDRLEADIAAFNQKNAAFGFESEAEFTAARNALIARSDALDAEADRINAEIDRYNGLVAELEALDADYAGLFDSLDSANAPTGP